MKQANAKVYASAIKMREKGASQKQVLEATGLNYSQLWYYEESAKLREAGKLRPVPETMTEFGVAIAQLRVAGVSWGMIAVIYQVPESRVRRAFKETGLDSRGLRIGKGGRWVDNDPRFYTGADRAKLGTELDPTLPVAAQVPDPEAVPVRVLPKISKGKAKRARRTRRATPPKALPAPEATPEATPEA
jgi:hypothetical protein